MLSKHFVNALLASVLVLPLFSCLSPAPTVSNQGSGVAVSKVNTVAGLMYFKVETARYDQPGIKTTKSTCQIFPGDPVTKTCTITIPEEELYYSKFFMTFGTGSANACKVIVFTPFAYLGSYSGAFLPPWDFNPSETDCLRDTLGERLGAACYNGAAKEIISGFPDKTQTHFFPDQGVEGTASATAPYEANMRFDNTWIANNLIDRSTTIPGRYVGIAGGQPNDLRYQDWAVYCLDEFYEPVYSVTIVISDQDITTGDAPGDPVLDDFYDWAGL